MKKRGFVQFIPPDAVTKETMTKNLEATIHAFHRSSQVKQLMEEKIKGESLQWSGIPRAEMLTPLTHSSPPPSFVSHASGNAKEHIH